MRRLREVLAAVAMMIAGVASATSARAADPLAVEVTNMSEPVLCAEKDNVTLGFTSSLVRRFKIEAAHPAYIGTVQKDSFEADWTACDMKSDPVFQSGVAKTRRQTLYEEPDFWLVGWTFPTYWRPSTAKVRVGDRTFDNLHLLQLWVIRPMGGEEVLVLYPQDGYWRIRPMAPEGRAPTAFGSSFLIGPVDDEGRPIVKIKDIEFKPSDRTFVLSFERGGNAVVKASKLDRDRHSLEVELSASVSGRPFAMMRSMYVTEFNNDVAHVAVKEKGARGWRQDGIMSFTRATATDVWAGRNAISRHNTSSPDMVFSGFAPAAATPPSKAATPAKK